MQAVSFPLKGKYHAFLEKKKMSRTSKAWVLVPPISDFASGRVSRLIASSREIWEKSIFCGTNSSISTLLTIVTALRILAVGTLKMDDRKPLLKPDFNFIKKIPKLFLGLRNDVFFTLSFTWEKSSLKSFCSIQLN